MKISRSFSISPVSFLLHHSIKGARLESQVFCCGFYWVYPPTVVIFVCLFINLYYGRTTWRIALTKKHTSRLNLTHCKKSNWRHQIHLKGKYTLLLQFNSLVYVLHKPYPLYYWDTCGSPLIKCLCFFVVFFFFFFFFLRHKMEKLRNSTQRSLGPQHHDN